MGQELFSIFRTDTRRVLWLMGLMFAMILAFQYLEFPYGFSLSSLLSAGNVSVLKEGSSRSRSPPGDPHSKTELVADAPLADGMNSTKGFTEVFEEQRDDEVVTDEEHTLKESLGSGMDVGANKSSSTGAPIDPVMNSTVDESKNNDLRGNDLSFDGKDSSLRNDSIGVNGTESYVSTLGYRNRSGDNFVVAPASSFTNASSMIVGNTSNVAQNSSSHDASIGSNAPETSDESKTSMKEKTDETNTSDKSEIVGNTSNIAPNSSDESKTSMKEKTVETNTSDKSEIVGNTSNIAPNSSSHDASIGSNAPETSAESKTHLKEKTVETNTSDKSEKTEQLHSDLEKARNKSEENKVPKVPRSGVYTLSEMDSLLLESRTSNSPIVPRWPSAADRELQQAKQQIEKAPVIDNDSNLYAPLFRNISIFKRSYELMERTLKVFIYREGEKPIFHQGPLQSIYASEGWFMKILESNKRFVTKNPKKAHLFYLPFSSRNLEEVLYVRDSHSHKNLIQHLGNYLDYIAAKYPYWNRTGGADHFLVACHDWAPAETRKLMASCIRALCNSDVKEGYAFGKDVSLPETYVRMARNPLRDIGGNPPSKRPILAFFAGSMHGYLRSILLEYWEHRDRDMKISGPLPKVKGSKNYIWHMKNSKYCICAKGYEVNSPRVVEAILYECVPVIISDNFVPPLFEALNWESFAVFVAEKDLENLKKILLSIPEKRYREMQMRVKKLQPHFLWHARPQRYDMFHMILHSIWYNRLYQIRPR